ncbi:MAG: ATP-binding protein [Deltaproteobacteria bacterium]|nr:ATP-binding protein [Deltaproteobacteria bacterium]
MLIDLDAKRASGISSTNDEHEAALAVGRRCYDYLIEFGFPVDSLVSADSGNGAHIDVRVELPNDDEATRLVKKCLETLALKFDNDMVKVDRGVYDANRPLKLYGTLAAKGDSPPDRPHRIARLLIVPESVTPTPREVLEKLAALAPEAPKHQPRGDNKNQPSFNLDDFIARHEIAIKSTKQWNDWQLHILEACPFNSEHNHGEVNIGQHSDGALSFKCKHDSCADKKWKDYRDIFEPNRASERGGDARPNQGDKLIEIALQGGAELFHTSTDEAHISFPMNGHRENWPVRSRATRSWLIQIFYQQTGKAPSNEATQTALNLLEAKARFDGETHDVHLRTAWCGASLYYDLCDEKWRAVEIFANGWRIVDKPPVRFIRHRHMRAQADPESGGNLDDLFKFINVKDGTDRKLLRAWIGAGLNPNIPRPALVLHGDQGAGKSTIAKRLRELIDPSGMSMLRGKDESEIVQGLSHHYCAIFDNLTTVGDWFSDLLCRAVTGEGFTKRQLYTDGEDILFAYQRLVILTGIGLSVTKPDLLDRSLIVAVERIPDDIRRRERELDVEFQQAKPALFGALLDNLAGAIRVYDNMKFTALPRMADFAAWAMAAELGAGRDPAAFRDTYTINVSRQNEEAIEASVVATTLFAAIDDGAEWKGSASELFAVLKAKAEELKVPAKSFPGSASALGRQLREIKPNLVAGEWTIEFAKTGKRLITITRKTPEYAVNAVLPSETASSLDSKDSMDSNNGSFQSFSACDPWNEAPAEEE